MRENKKNGTGRAPIDILFAVYRAILRCGTSPEQQRAVALYNSYCFGYALGMSFRNEAGRREMLWREDLEQILAAGRTAEGCALH